MAHAAGRVADEIVVTRRESTKVASEPHRTVEARTVSSGITRSGTETWIVASDAPRTTESIAERTVYDVLRQQLPAGWYAWHSVRIQVPPPGTQRPTSSSPILGAGPSSSRSRGGRIEQREGLWYSNGQLLKVDPLVQAQRFRHMLLDLLRSKGISFPPIEIATIFPDTPFSNAPSQGDLFGRTLGKRI